MATDKKKLTVYPSPRALDVLGTYAPNLNEAIECWAEQIKRGTKAVEAKFNRAEWSYLADMLNATHHDPAFDAAQSLALSVRDADRYDGLGEKWLERTGDVERLAKKIEALSYHEAWAVIYACRTYWEHAESIDLQKDHWWTMRFRAAL